MTTSLIKTGQTESYLVSMVHDILTSSSGDHQKIQDLTLLMENTNEYTPEHHRIQHLLTTSDHQRYHGIPGFHSIAPISRGGFGRVYQATHGVDGHTYAIKTIPIRNSNQLSTGHTDTVLSKLREARCLARLQHPNIIRYYNSWLDIGISKAKPDTVTSSKSCESLVEYGVSQHILEYESTGSSTDQLTRSHSLDQLVPLASTGPEIRTTLFIQTELMELNLRDWIRNNKHQASYTRDTLYIMKQICQGVKYLHTMVPTIIHCDLKPENILLNCHDGWPTSVKIADFGLVSIPETNLGLTQSQGTSTYQAPELKTTDLTSEVHPTKATDIYSLGIVLFELVNPTETMMERSVNIEKFKQGQIKTNTIIDRMVSLDPGKRPSIIDTIREIQTVEKKGLIQAQHRI